MQFVLYCYCSSSYSAFSFRDKSSEIVVWHRFIYVQKRLIEMLADALKTVVVDVANYWEFHHLSSWSSNYIVTQQNLYHFEQSKCGGFIKPKFTG